ncbi:phospholipase D-like domain-containing protein [Burkholderia ubonensis]|uniref:phospholipase D-like domain-containing protein n=1 Tax=Burkholderia ubonensis TaxID=101571 RepID=UPI001E2914C2|nr:phospholipase D-like domain-containing protein [Burkholderia ubonensis]
MRKVLHTPSVQELIDTYGLRVSIARLRTSGMVGDRMAYREIYIHSKLMIIDDVFITLGSANLNQRSMAADSEINIAATGKKYAAKLREDIFKLHSDGQISGSGDPSQVPEVFNAWEALMDENNELRKKGEEPLNGFLLPFEDHRSTTTMHASVDIPSSGNTALA